MSSHEKISVGIVGATGYTGGELLRILLLHPMVGNVYAQSRSQSGKPISEVHSDLFFYSDLQFMGQIPQNVDVLFLCLPHGEAINYLKDSNTNNQTIIIDLSQDFRLHRNRNEFIYGLPELNLQQIKHSNHIANPGCFATAIQIALLPLAQAKMLTNAVHISAITGSTGAGAGFSTTAHYTWRTNNISSYKVFDHQHLGEISQSIVQLQGNCPAIHFIPYRGSFTRGILASCYTECSLSQEELDTIFQAFYTNNPFITIVSTHPNVKQVTGTNNACVYVKKHDNIVFVEAVIDNLLKGASGQAVQNMNIAMGWSEDLGLKFKSPAY